jgi:poly(3-hydroxybutyrate) depolymerase
VVAFVVVLSLQRWTGSSTNPLVHALLRINIVSGGVPIAAYTLAGGALLLLLLRRPSRRWIITSVIALAVGALVAVLVLWYVAATDAFGVQLSAATSACSISTFAAVAFAISNVWSTTLGRRLAALLGILFSILAGVIGVNADFGLDQTPADLAGISTQSTFTLPLATVHPTPAPTPLAGGALWANWHAPADLPSVGTTGQVVIPNTVSGFTSRPAGVYIPPAGLVKDPPALPLVIMMMGQPGNPDPSFTASILGPMASAHSGLAPIVLVVDQIGNPAIDPLCLDTARYGKAETFLTQDVVSWARTHLHVLQDAAHWTVAGYSNGGECALALGVKFPLIWGNVLDISGEEYPGADRAAATRIAVFGGSQAAYDAQKPLGQLAAHSYPDTVGIFTVGSNDYGYRQQALTVAAAARAANWKTTYFEVPNGGHVLGALMGGLQEGYTVLYPRLGLSQ